jgi:hypothetical protein
VPSARTYGGHFWELNAWQLLDEFHEERSRQSAILKVIHPEAAQDTLSLLVETMHAAHTSDLIRLPFRSGHMAAPGHPLHSGLNAPHALMAKPLASEPRPKLFHLTHKVAIVRLWGSLKTRGVVLYAVTIRLFLPVCQQKSARGVYNSKNANVPPFAQTM